MLRNAHRAGDKVPESGVFWVHHYAHRMTHLARLAAGETFPNCLVCHDRVRFEPSTDTGSAKAGHISLDRDFHRASAAD